MFKIGDTVVCINISTLIKEDYIDVRHVKLTIGKKYDVIDVCSTIYNNDSIVIKVDDGVVCREDQERFILLSEYRKLKLKKICSKLVIE